LPIADSDVSAIPQTMHAAVYRGSSVVDVEEIPTPAIGPGEILIRVEACGICHTDLKKIEHNLLTPPRVYGDETAGADDCLRRHFGRPAHPVSRAKLGGDLGPMEQSL